MNTLSILAGVDARAAISEKRRRATDPAKLKAGDRIKAVPAASWI